MVDLFPRCPDPRRQPHRWQEGGSLYRHVTSDDCNHLARPSHHQPPLSWTRSLRSGFSSDNMEMPMFFLSEGPQQSAPTAVAPAAAAPAAEAVIGTRAFPAVSSKGVAGAPASSAGAASAAVLFSPLRRWGGWPGRPLLQMEQRPRRPAVLFPSLHQLGGRPRRQL